MSDQARAPGIDTSRKCACRAATVVAVLMLAGTFLLISPDPEAPLYPGTRPWASYSILKMIVSAMSLGGAVATVRGAEIKDFVFHLGSAAILLLLGVRLVVVRRPRVPDLTSGKGVWFFAQLLLCGWVAIAAASAIWSGDPAISRAQATLYALHLAWAIGLAWTLGIRGVERVGVAIVAVGAAAGALCVWYYYERNPYHRPNFPLGNPGTLAASLLPAIILAIVYIARVVWPDRPEGLVSGPRRRPDAAGAVGAAVALIPLGWCFWLTSARAAAIGLLVGVAVMALLVASVILRARRRTILGMLVGVALLCSLAGWLIIRATDIDIMRSATVRFRTYMWRYAADLWMQRPISGLGAGSFARLVGAYSVQDRALDPAAFMGDWAGHAHNELFEALTEIGLVGGVTLVGGFVATLLSGLRLVRISRGDPRLWLWMGLPAALAAQLTEMMFNTSLRLSGVPAVFFTLLGAIWAACRVSETPEEASVGDASGPALLRDVLERTRGGLAGIVTRLQRRITVPAGMFTIGLAGLAAAAAITNWSGVRHEHQAQSLLRSEQPLPALEHARLAEERLLDPLRKLYSDVTAARCRFEIARREFALFRQLANPAPGESDPTTTQPASEPAVAAPAGNLQPSLEAARARATEAAAAAYQAALRVEARAPTLGNMPKIAARSAEFLLHLYGYSNHPAALDWKQAAHSHWWEQRSHYRYDVDAALALVRYRPLHASVDWHILYLCEALRSGFSPREWWEAPETAAWNAALRTVAGHPAFDDTLNSFMVQVGPADPRTNLDSLVISMAPEVYRLAAAYTYLKGNPDGAARYAARAAELYEPMRRRFPTLFSVALAEHADYLFRANPAEPDQPIRIMTTAIDALPAIQAQHFDFMAFPFRRQLALYLLSAGRIDEAARAAGRALGVDGAMLDRALSGTKFELKAMGLEDEGSRTVRSAIADQYVEFFDWFRNAPAGPRPPIDRFISAALELVRDHTLAWSRRAWLDCARGDIAEAQKTLTEAARAGVAQADIERIRAGLRLEFPNLGF